MTAVEFLVSKISSKIDDKYYSNQQDITEYVKEANKMFEQQILDAFTKGADDGYDGIYDSNKEQYYNSTYGSKGSDNHIVDTNEMVDQVPDVRKMVSSQTEISDEEIEKASENAWSDYEYEEGNLYSTTFKGGWKLAIKWYREQLKQKQ